MYHALSLNGNSKIINAVKRQRNLGLGIHVLHEKGRGEQGVAKKGRGEQGMAKKGRGEQGMAKKGRGEQGMAKKGRGALMTITLIIIPLMLLPGILNVITL